MNAMGELAINDAFDGILAAAKAGNMDDLKAISGQGADTPKQGLARLNINYDTETDEGKTLPRGQWKVFHDGRFIYAPEITFRALMRTYEYSVWDAEENKFSSRSIQNLNLTGSFPDTAGGDKCGRLSKSDEEQLGDDHPRVLASRSATCNQVFYALITMKGKDADGTEVELTDYPVMAYFKRSGFRPAKDAIDKISNMGKLMPQTVFNLTTSRKKMGSVTYYVPVFTYEGDTEMSQDDWDLLAKFTDTIKASNNNIMEQYREAQKLLVTEEEVDLAADFK
jgi:hypothetical protein